MERILCFFCTKACQDNDVIYDVAAVTMQCSERPLHLVLQHLANRIQIQLVFSEHSNTYICEGCFNDLQDYDRLMSDLLATQKRLTVQLKQAIGVAEVEAVGEDTTKVPGQSVFEAVEPASADIGRPENNENTIATERLESQGELSGNLVHSDQDELPEPSECRRRRPLRKCEICSVTFRTKFQLQQHMNEVHNRKRFVCPICGVVRKDEEYLELHMNLHQGKTEYECRYCSKQFSRPVNTLRHMRIHWDKKKFQCEKCGKRFSLDNMLYNHRMLHEAEENPIICSVCKNSFKSRKTYNHHVRIHQVDRPRYHCHLCPKSFTERYTLKMHLRNHELRGEACEEPTETSTESPETVVQTKESAETGARNADTDNSILLLIPMPDAENEYNCIVCN